MKNSAEYFQNYLDIIQDELSERDKLDINYILNELINLNVYNNDFLWIDKGDTIIDIGLNFGLFSLDALRYNPKKIIAFEPNPKLVSYFKKLNLDKVEVNQLAVSNKNGKTTFYENTFPGRSSLHSDMSPDTVKSSYEVNIISINDIIKNYENIDYFKVDCEGAEYEIFEAIDGEYLKNKIKKIAIEFHNVPTDVKVINLKNKIESAGFEVKIDYCGSGTTGMLYAKK